MNVLFFGLISVALLGTRAPGARVLGAIVGTLLLGAILLGTVAIARLAGDRLRPGDAEPRRLVVGMGTVWLALLVPIVGWYLLALLVSLAGSGATILAMFRSGEPPPSIDPTESPRTMQANYEGEVAI